MKPYTTIRIRKATRDRIAQHGRYTDTLEDIVIRLLDEADGVLEGVEGDEP
jgi:hypothetical protein